MKTKLFPVTAPSFALLNTLALSIQNDTAFEALHTLRALRMHKLFKHKKGWQANFAKLETIIQTGMPQYSIFALSGNSKLPFIAFSTLPGVTCPGAGACLDFCYSFRAWRYPAAFMRQCQNAWLMKYNKPAISNAFSTVDATFNNAYDMRLYVDGDFSSVNDVNFWFNEIANKPNARVYGYSKSFIEILSCTVAMPINYMLNISSGHNAPASIIDKVKALSITRGEFIAVSIGRKIKGNEHGTVAVNKALREAYGAKAFPCPGTCGTCTGKGHACGMQSLKNIPIIIAIH